MLKKILKTAGIAGGVLAFSEICGVLGEAQAFAGMYKAYPEETQKFIDAMDDPEITEDLSTFRKAKLKVLKKVTEVYIEET